MASIRGIVGLGYADNSSVIALSTTYPVTIGQRARDIDGNEYLFVKFSGSAGFYYGQVVQITADNIASPLLGTARVAARVGVVTGGQPTTANHVNQSGSNQGGWVMIYGLMQAVQTGSASGGLVSDGTVPYIVVPQTSVGTPSGVMSLITQVAGTSIEQTSTDLPRIYGMWVMVDAQVSNLVTAWPSSNTSGPASDPVDPGMNPVSGGAPDGLNVSFDNTSAFIGNTHVCFLNYPYVTGIDDVIGTATT